MTKKDLVVFIVGQEAKMTKHELIEWQLKNVLSQKDLAEILGVSTAQVYAWRNGNRLIPKWLALALAGIEIYRA